MSEIEATDVLEPQVEHLHITLGQGEETFTLVQKPLSFFGKLEFFSIMGKAVEQAIDDGLSVGDLFDAPNQEDGLPLSADSFKEADVFVKAIAQVVQHTPELLGDLYCVLLGVPRGQREYVKNVMERHQDDGGLSDEQGIAIVETFVDQNWDVMVDFFSLKLSPLVAKVSKKLQGSESSKPSKPTRQRTRKQSQKS